MSTFGIVAHGGAGVIKPLKRSLRALERATEEGYRLVAEGASALEAVERTIVMLEDHPGFNAGRGSRLQLDAIIRMDASIMDGEGLRAGAVAALEDIKNPIGVARAIMEETEHVMLVGDKAKRFALSHGFPEADVYTSRRRKSWEKSLGSDHRHKSIYRDVFEGDTVGAVALDRSGRLASGSSTGGGTYMLPGRVGDTPIIGSGIYADSRFGAVSATGPGEFIMRTVFSKMIVDFMSDGMTPRRALEAGTEILRKVTGGRVGAIALDPRGRIGIWHSTPHMYYSYRVKGKEGKTGAEIR